MWKEEKETKVLGEQTHLVSSLNSIPTHTIGMACEQGRRQGGESQGWEEYRVSILNLDALEKAAEPLTAMDREGCIKIVLTCSCRPPHISESPLCLALLSC